MIQINLLDQPGSKGKPGAQGVSFSSAARPGGSPAGGILIVLALALLLALDGGLFYYAYSQVEASTAALNTVKAKQKKLKSEIEKKTAMADQVRQYREVVANQMDVLKSLDPPDRILWCEKINALSNLMPPNVFLAQFKVDENVKMVETQQSVEARAKWAKSPKKGSTKEPAAVQKPVISYSVLLVGLALGKDNVEQMQNVTAFHKALIDNSEQDAAGKTRRFMDGFNDNIEFESVEATMYEGTPVNKFIFRLTTKPMGSDEPAAASAGPGGKNPSTSQAAPPPRRRPRGEDSN
jgi:hypothetical protein